MGQIDASRIATHANRQTAKLFAVHVHQIQVQINASIHEQIVLIQRVDAWIIHRLRNVASHTSMRLTHVATMKQADGQCARCALSKDVWFDLPFILTIEPRVTSGYP